jgi:hypothetical protein
MFPDPPGGQLGGAPACVKLRQSASLTPVFDSASSSGTKEAGDDVSKMELPALIPEVRWAASDDQVYSEPVRVFFVS